MTHKRMNTRYLLVMLWALVLLAGLSLRAIADSSVPDGKKPAPTKSKGKPGDACKTANDCDQSNEPQSCQASKCRIMPPPMPVPTT